MGSDKEDHDPQMDKFEPPVDEEYPPQSGNQPAPPPPANQRNQRAQANQQYQRPPVNRSYAAQPAVNQALAIGMTLLNQLPQMMDEEYQYTDETEEVPMDEEIHFSYDHQEYDDTVNGEDPLPAENQQEPVVPMNQQYASSPVNQRNQRVQVNRSYAPRNANQQYQPQPVDRSYVPQPPMDQQQMMDDTDLYYDENDFPYETEENVEYEGEDDQYFPESSFEELEAYHIPEGDEYQQPTSPENQQDPLQPVNQQNQREPMNQQTQQTRMTQQSQRTRVNQQSQQTRVNPQSQRTRVNQQSQRTQVNQQGQRLQVTQQSQRTQMNQQSQRTQVNQQGQRSQENLQSQRTQVNQHNQRPTTNRVHPSTQVNQQNQRPPVEQQPRYNPPSPVPGYPQPVPQGQGVWSTDLFDCFNDVPLFCTTLWCPCITFGHIAEIVDKRSFSCNTSGGIYALILLFTGCHFIYSGGYRTKMRLEYGIPGDDAEDFCTHFWCESCALVQEYTELTKRGYNVPLGWQGNINLARQKQAQGVQMAPKAPNGMTR